MDNRGRCTYPHTYFTTTPHAKIKILKPNTNSSQKVKNMFGGYMLTRISIWASSQSHVKFFRPFNCVRAYRVYFVDVSHERC